MTDRTCKQELQTRELLGKLWYYIKIIFGLVNALPDQTNTAIIVFAEQTITTLAINGSLATNLTKILQRMDDVPSTMLKLPF
jgi:hypothetical protein